MSDTLKADPIAAMDRLISELRADAPLLDLALLDHVERQAREYGTRPNRSFAHSTVGGANVARFADAVLVLTDALRRGPGAGGA